MASNLAELALTVHATELAVDEFTSAADGSCSWQAIVLPSLILCVGMLVVASVAASLAELQISGLFFPYIGTAAATTLLCTLGFVFIEIAKLAPSRADRPIGIVWHKLRERLQYLILPALVFPLFLAGFTAAKSAIPFLAGYSWDSLFADADRVIFGDDAWRVAYSLAGTSGLRFLEWSYTVGWGFMLFAAGPLVALYAEPRKVGVFYTAMLATWLLGGCGLAYAFSAAGPVFAGAFDPSLEPHFAALHHFLDANLGSGPIAQTQAYLIGSVHSHIAVKGGGISAMPSMHVGAAAIYTFAARGTRWLMPTSAFCGLIFFCSGYFGYHYWIDGIAAAFLAAICWRAAETLYARAADHRAPSSKIAHAF